MISIEIGLCDSRNPCKVMLSAFGPALRGPTLGGVIHVSDDVEGQSPIFLAQFIKTIFVNECIFLLNLEPCFVIACALIVEIINQDMTFTGGAEFLVIHKVHRTLQMMTLMSITLQRLISMIAAVFICTTKLGLTIFVSLGVASLLNPTWICANTTLNFWSV